MSIDEARAIVAQMNAQERASIPEKLERLTLAHLPKPVHEWILSVSRKEGDRIRAIILAEKQRLETAPDTYQLGRWNEAGLAFLDATINSPSPFDVKYKFGYKLWRKAEYFAVRVSESCQLIGIGKEQGNTIGGIAPEHIELL